MVNRLPENYGQNLSVRRQASVISGFSFEFLFRALASSGALADIAANEAYVIAVVEFAHAAAG
ncbi:MAG: hypothetical protein DIU63_13450 [Proteobacteria bacterium]|nr:MAG: hypothetical protein DIU63_13450 [Pseudomonadota bacterium]